MTTHISSLQNQRIKDVLKLDKRAERDARRVTVVEGSREVSRALAAGIIPIEAYICPELTRSAETRSILHTLETFDQRRVTRLYTVSPDLFGKLAVREQSDGILLLIPYLRHSLADTPLRPHPLIAVIEGVEKPGNLGAILRSADGAGADAVIVTAGATDIHNPNVVRASLGAIFTVPVIEAPPADIIAWLRRLHIKIVAASPDATNLYTQIDVAGATAIVMGSEAHGLSAQWRHTADTLVRIPMHGVVDSLNLATATALLLYECVRQRSDR